MTYTGLPLKHECTVKKAGAVNICRHPDSNVTDAAQLPVAHEFAP